MNLEKPLSIIDIAGELNSGTATLKFILKRFSPWLPFEHIDGHPYYSRNTIPILIKIQESLEAGLLPSEIDQELKTESQKSPDQKTNPHFLEQPNEDIRVSKDGLTLIKSLFDDIAVQQNRVATAHEKRAEAEERKAVAIEKRAEAEEKKAIAMNNIAHALQEMNHHRGLDSQEMALQAAQVMTLETNQEMDLADLKNTGLDDTRIKETGQQDDLEIFDSPDPSVDLLEASEIQMDDLSDLIQEDILLEDPLVDVHDIPKDVFSEEPKDSNEKFDTAPELDDLTALIDPEALSPENPAHSPVKNTEALEIDDLSLLVDPKPEPVDLDDLSALIDTVSTQTSPETDLCPDLSSLDDLSLLIEDSASLETPELDDLSLLIQTPTAEESHTPRDMDDLSVLITDSAAPDSTPPMESPVDDLMDDLGALISDTPSLKPDITPEENLKEYKAIVMKIILGLKNQHLSAEETTKRLNQDGVQTISGKSQWSETAIYQIYKFIDSAK